MMGRHSVILRPDSVRRVMPPTTTTAKTSVEEIISQIPTERGARIGRVSGVGGTCAFAVVANVRKREVVDVGVEGVHHGR